MEASVGRHPTRQAGLVRAVRQGAVRVKGTCTTLGPGARGRPPAQARLAFSQGQSPSRPTRRPLNRESIEARCLTREFFYRQRQGAPGRELIRLCSRLAPGLVPLGNGEPGGSTRQDPRKSRWGRRAPPHCGRAVSVRPKKRESQREQQKQEKPRGSAPAAPRRTGSSFPAARPPRFRPRPAPGHAPSAGPGRTGPLRPPTEVPPLPPVPPLPAHVWAPGTPRWYAAVVLCCPRVLLPGFLVCRSRGAPALSAMGVPKRKAAGGQDSTGLRAGAAKRARTEELTGVRFKAELRGPQGAEPGECGAGRGREHVRARRVAAACQAQPSSVHCSVPESQSRAFRFADGKPWPRCSGVPGPGRPGLL